MTSVRKKTSSEIFRTPRWLRGPPRSLRSIINPEEVSIYRRMRKAVIQELRPKTPIEWILVNEFVNGQFSAMRYGTWQAAVMQFSVGEGLRRAVKNRLRSGNKGSEADLDWRAQELAGSMRPYVNDHAIEAEMYLSRRSEMDSIHKRQLSAQLLMKRLPKVATEMALHVLAYNLTRVMDIMGIQPLMAAIRA